MRTAVVKWRAIRAWTVLLAAAAILSARLAPAQDVSQPVILQYFEGSYGTIEQRLPDIFNAGYGMIYTPPPGRADSGNQSVGYDPYNRFDLGSPGNPILYGTETGLKTLVSMTHRAGMDYYLDMVWNHDGFSNLGTPGFASAGGYPGFALTLNPSNNSAGYNDFDGDFHSAFDNSTTGMRLSGLIDIAQEKNYQFIRNPVDPNNPQNLPAGTTPAYGRLANVADPNNARFYPDKSLQPIRVYDPTTGEQNIRIYPFNNANPMNGTPVAENALGYLMRNTQWLVQYVGVDGFRIDAAKNMPPWVLNYYDRAVYRSSFGTNLDGTQKTIAGFSEVYDGDKSLLQQYVRKDINPPNPGVIGGNRDVLDFPLFFAMQSNLGSNGLQNSWLNVANASIDTQDDGLNNGSQGVKFVSSQDNTGPYLSNVAYAYTMMTPGKALVYFNAHEFGSNRNFPQDGRGDALGGMYGNAITTLVDLRNRYGRGNFIPRDLEKEVYIFERDNSALVGLNNRLDAGYDSRTVQTNFAPGTYLVELTGNAANPAINPDGAIPQVLQVSGTGTVSLRVPRNTNDNGVFTGDGYVVYGPASPKGTVTINNVARVLPGSVPTDPSQNGTTRLNNINVVTGNSFGVTLNTSAMTLPGGIRDHNADGDNALLKFDGGVDLNGNGHVDFVTPGAVSYGFEQFTGTHSPGYFNADGNGTYFQNIDTMNLAEGMHYLTVRAFRHRADGGPAIFTDFREAIYVDRLPPVSAIDSFNSSSISDTSSRQILVRSVDQTANSVHVFLNLPAAFTNAQILSMIGDPNHASQIDRDLFSYAASNVPSGNNVATVVTYEMTGNYSIQRFAGLAISSNLGAGLGDLNLNGAYDPNDIARFNTVFSSNNTLFNPAADLNGDGVVDERDLLLLGPRLAGVGANAATVTAYNGLLVNPPAGVTRTVTATFDNSSGAALYKTSPGTLIINGPQIHGLSASLTLSAGSTSIDTDAGIATAANLSLVVNRGAAATFGSTQHLSALHIDGAYTTLTGGGNKFISTNSLLISSLGKLDLADNSLIIRATPDTRQRVLDQITGYIASAYDRQKWDGPGLTSSAAAGDPLRGLAVIPNERMLLDGTSVPLYTTFDGEAVDQNCILVKYTLNGDMNLDGIVNFDDYFQINSGFLSNGKLTGYRWGDLNFDGVVNFDDYFLLNTASIGQDRSPASVTNAVVIPEPSSALLIALCSIVLARRKRIRHWQPATGN